MRESESATVLVAGASGGTGAEISRLLAPRPPTVRTLTRDASGTDRLRAAGADEVVVGDLFDPADAERAVEGVDVVLSAVGSSPLQVWTADEFVDGAGNLALFEAAAAADVEAVVMVSALGVGDEPASALGRLFDLVVGPVQRAKAEAERRLRELPVRHTILRAGALTNGARTDDVVVAEPGARLWGPIPRGDVARLAIAAPVTDAAADRTFEVVRNPFQRDRGLEIDWQLP